MPNCWIPTFSKTRCLHISRARRRVGGRIGGAEESAEPSRLAKDERRRLHWARERDTAQRPFGGMLLDLAGCVPLLARESALTRASLVESFGRGNQNLIVRHLKFSCPHRAGQSRKTRNAYLVFFTYDEPHWRTQVCSSRFWYLELGMSHAPL